MTNEEARAILEEVETIDDSMYQYNPAYLEALNKAITALKAKPCEDAVKRQAVITVLDWHEHEKSEVESYIREIAEDIKALPSVTPKPRWVPVSERLPENRNLVLVTAYWHETYQVMVGSYWGNGVWWCAPWNNTSREHLKMLNAIAWMPLPEPYKEGESDETAD